MILYLKPVLSSTALYKEQQFLSSSRFLVSSHTELTGTAIVPPGGNCIPPPIVTYYYASFS